MIDEKKELEEQAGMAMTDAGVIMDDLEREMPAEPVTQEQKDSNPIQFKYEVSLKKMPKKLRFVKDLTVGKIGRVVEVIDEKTILVDFWNSVPAKLPIKNSWVTVHRTRKEVEIANGTYIEENIPEVKESAKTDQIGGNHYKNFPIQPIEFIHKNNLSFCQGNIVKYICRYKDKNGAEDLKKVIHYAQLLLEMEYSDEG